MNENKEVELEIVGAYTDGELRILIDTHLGPPSYIKTLYCGNYNRSGQLCLMQGSESKDFYAQFSNSFGGSVMYKAEPMPNSGGKGNRTSRFKIDMGRKISDLVAEAPNKRGEIKADLLTNGRSDMGPFRMLKPIAEKRAPSKLRFD